MNSGPAFERKKRKHPFIPIITTSSGGWDGAYDQDKSRRNLTKTQEYFLCFPQWFLYSRYSGATSLTSFLGDIVKPSISHRNCFPESCFTSFVFRGHWKFPASRRLYKRQYPSFSQTRPLILSDLLPQKRYNVFGIRGFSPDIASTVAARRSIPYRRSVLPVIMKIFSNPVASLSMSNHLDYACEQV